MPLDSLSYVIFSAHVVAILVCFILLMIIWYYWYAVGMKIANTTIMVLSMISIALYLFNSVLLAIGSVGIWDISSIADLFGTPVWASSQICTYLVFTNRFKLSFKNTNYALSNTLYFVYYFIITIYILLNYTEIIIYILFKFTSININADDYEDYLILTCFFVLVIDLFLSISLLWTFLHKLVGLHIDIGQQSNARYKQNTIIHVMSKMNILTTISVLSSQVFVIWVFVINAMYRFGFMDFGEYFNALRILFVLWAFENIINAICIYLSFEFAGGVYNKFCRGMHYFCVRLCIKWTRKRTIKIKTKQMKESLEVPFLSDDSTEHMSNTTFATYSKATYNAPTIV